MVAPSVKARIERIENDRKKQKQIAANVRSFQVILYDKENNPIRTSPEAETLRSDPDAVIRTWDFTEFENAAESGELFEAEIKEPPFNIEAKIKHTDALRLIRAWKKKYPELKTVEIITKGNSENT